MANGFDRQISALFDALRDAQLGKAKAARDLEQWTALVATLESAALNMTEHVTEPAALPTTRHAIEREMKELTGQVIEDFIFDETSPATERHKALLEELAQISPAL